MIRRTPLKRVSKKRAKDMKTYSAQRKVFLEKNPSCQICHEAYATDVHHGAGRSGPNYLDETHWFALCNPCHIHKVHGNPKWARANGYLV